MTATLSRTSGWKALVVSKQASSLRKSVWRELSGLQKSVTAELKVSASKKLSKVTTKTGGKKMATRKSK